MKKRVSNLDRLRKKILIVRNIMSQLKFARHKIRKEVLKNLTLSGNVDGINENSDKPI